MQYAITKKAFAVASAFFVYLLFVITAQADDLCPLDKKAGHHEKVQLDYVVDGDTVWLKDGRKIRISSINTPEIEREDKPGEPFGDDARNAANSFLKKDKQLILQTNAGKKDNYGRVLGELFRPDGSSLSAHLLRQGLAFQIFNDSDNIYQDCFFQLEEKARQERKGVWSLNPVRNVKSGKLHGGFTIVQGKIASTGHSKKSPFVWLETDGDVVLRVDKKAVDNYWLKQVMGKNIEARGWMVDRANSKRKIKKGHKRWMLLVYSTDSIKISPLTEKSPKKPNTTEVIR